jgi:hypothetical protein
MSEGDFRESLLARVNGIQAAMAERVSAALESNSSLAYDLKESEKHREFSRTALSDFGRRLAILEKQMREVIASSITGGQSARPGKRRADVAPPGPGDVDDTLSDADRAADMPALPALVRYIPAPRAAPLPPWRKELKEAVEKLGTALPELSSIAQLAAYFHVSYSLIRNTILQGRMAIVREGRVIAIPRESVAEYVRIYGVPHPRRLFYGSAGIVEIPRGGTP